MEAHVVFHSEFVLNLRAQGGVISTPTWPPTARGSRGNQREKNSQVGIQGWLGACEWNLISRCPAPQTGIESPPLPAPPSSGGSPSQTPVSGGVSTPGRKGLWGCHEQGMVLHTPIHR